MNVQVIRLDGDRKREVWTFYWPDGSRWLKFTGYIVQTRPTRRHRTWQTQTRWSVSSESGMKRPTVPADVVAEAKGQLYAVIQALQVEP